MQSYAYTVPENKKIRLIVLTDCKNEADDQFALAHHLMTPGLFVKGIVPAISNCIRRNTALARPSMPVIWRSRKSSA